MAHSRSWWSMERPCGTTKGAVLGSVPSRWPAWLGFGLLGLGLGLGLGFGFGLGLGLGLG